jgi:L-threonylcarbamoyladenylate synthase
MPDHPVALALIRAVGSPVAAPSANRSGRPSPTTAQHVVDDLGGNVDVLDGGPCSVGVESTVVRLSPEHCIVLRPGRVSSDELQRALGMPVEIASGAEDLRASPGTRYRHYAPSCSVVLCSTEDELRAKVDAAETSLMVLATQVFADLPEGVISALLSEPTLYAELRRADDLQLGGILVLCDHTVQGRDALINRLQKAASASEEHL